MIGEWKDVVGYEGHYKVSDSGFVFSIPRQGSRTWIRGGLLKSALSEGYPAVSLRKDGRSKSHKIHKLVLEAFEGPCPPGYECRHLDGKRTNNEWPDNIEWSTPSENNKDKTRHGTNPVSKITDHQVVEAFCAWEAKISASMLASNLCVSTNGLRHRMMLLDPERYESLAVGNRKLSNEAALVFYKRWTAGESKSALAREAKVSRRLLTFRFNDFMEDEDPFADITKTPGA